MEIWVFCGIKSTRKPLQAALGLDRMFPRPTWFPGARMNYTENILAGEFSRPDTTAVSACGEGGVDWEHLSWRQLRSRVEKWTSALHRAGVRVGDRVGGKKRTLSPVIVPGSADLWTVVMTNSIDCLILLLASAAIGAIFSSTAPDMGVRGIVERYRQISPKILFFDTVVTYGGKRLDLRGKLQRVADEMRELVPGLGDIVVVKGQKFPGQKMY